MTQPVIYTDFDGVINAFPDEKILRRGGQTHLDWLKPGDPRAALYAPDHAFLLDGNERVRIPQGTYRIHWSHELADKLIDCAQRHTAKLCWLSTWQPYTSLLNTLLGWDAQLVETVHWYDPVTGQGLFTGKRSTVFRRVEMEKESAESAPLIWIDDEECFDTVAMQIESLEPAAPVLMIRPDDRIGISRRQWQLISDFLRHQPDQPAVTLDEEPTIHTHAQHLGF